MKIYLDDERKPPEGWILVRWPKEAIEYLEQGNVECISLDHDLGDDSLGTGYDVILWIEKQVVENGFQPPEMKVHSANVSARVKMTAGIKNIYKLFKQISSNNP
ncbi:cyclic-phosphate processing receiver domain-containing protein [Enterovibrio calviensis]|uniref:cyclic-phosphate processing receiver domain-containing protein n=1 Tax=Enterovibrio calviensis TaxID=91359 RepID=UPI000480FCAF|nr:cyclic-phosphate processing receiver domain-containing protein [Enterovibrio calviensis]